MFPALAADDVSAEPTEVESLCLSCEKNGSTRILLTKIPHYKEIILMSFECPHCGLKNNEVQSGGMIQEQGVRYTVTISTERDLSRQIVKSDYATLTIPEIDLEIPALSQKGEVSTVEGVLQRTIAGLEQDQAVRRVVDTDSADKIDQFVIKIKETLEMKTEFSVVIDDPSGNSFIENPLAPSADPGRKVTYYERTAEQDHSLGMYSKEELRENGEADEALTSPALTAQNLQEEVLTFATNCPECNAPCQTNMKVTKIPFFKEVVIMATVCDACGVKTNEVKSGGGIEDKGRRITLHVTDPSDMNRDILKSETGDIAIPELDLEMGGAALGGRFTTLEGLMNNVLELVQTNPMWGGGDATSPDVTKRMEEFKEKLKDLINNKKNFTFVLDDPAGNSYLQNVYAPDDDPEMKVELYERSFDQNEELGLNDMKVENYGED